MTNAYLITQQVTFKKQSYYQYSGLCEIKAIRPFLEHETTLVIYGLFRIQHITIARATI